MIEPSTRADQWLATVLKADSAVSALVGTRVYADVAPQGATFPVVVAQFMAAGPDEYVVGPYLLYSNMLFVVKAIDKTNSYRQDIADAAESALHNKTGNATGAKIIYCRRETPMRLVDVVNNVEYRHLGASFRIWVQPT